MQALLLGNELRLNELLCVDFLIIAAEEVCLRCSPRDNQP